MSRFPRLLSILGVGALASAIAATPALASSSALYRIEGRGWGHGIGMSQYGADGFAAHGMTGEQIITHYYSGTVVAPAPATAPANVRVLLKSGLDTGRVTVTSPGVLAQGGAQLAIAAGDDVEFQALGGSLVATRIHLGVRTAVASGSNADATITPDVDGSIKVGFKPDTGSTGSVYRGTFTGHLSNGKVSAVNTLPLESYLRGVVPGEMPASWHAEALKAQAIAARAYALTGITGSGYFDVYATTQSQVYGGKSYEQATTDAAIAATAGMVPHIGDANGAVARTYFYSTSAGRSAANEDVWGGTPLSYLRSVASPYETSKYFNWTGSDVQTYKPLVLAAKFGSLYGGKFTGITQTNHASGYVDKVTVHGSTRSDSTSGSNVQSKLGLRSSFFRIYLLSISAPTTAKVGTYVKFGGQAPLLGATTVTFSTNGVAGKPVKLKVTKSGLWAIHFKVRGKVIARMSRGGALGPAIAVTTGAATTPAPPTTPTSPLD